MKLRNLCKECRNKGCGPTSLIYAVKVGHLKCMKILLRAGNDINLVDHNNCNLFVHAILGNQINSVKFLVSNGFRLSLLKKNDILNFQHNIPFFLAVRRGCTQIVDFMIQNKLYNKLEDEFGKTPLHYAVYDDSFDIIPMLLAMGNDVININHLDIFEKSAISYLRHSDIFLIELFINCGSHLDVHLYDSSFFFKMIVVGSDQYLKLVMKFMENNKSLLMIFSRFLDILFSQLCFMRNIDLNILEYFFDYGANGIVQCEIPGPGNRKFSYYLYKRPFMSLINASHYKGQIFDPRLNDSRVWRIVWRYILAPQSPPP